jgi:hypothetical protein
MRFVLFVEGHTERKAVPQFLKKWLDAKLTQPVGIQPVRFEGWSEFIGDVDKKARLYLLGPGNADVIAVIGLLDLYGPTIYPQNRCTARDRVAWATEHIEKKVGHPKFRQFFAVHEIEAWLLSQPNVFPRQVRNGLPNTIIDPEKVNFSEPPSHLLDRVYKQTTHKKYKKVVYGTNLFARLDPTTAYDKCPNLRLLLDTMLTLAKTTGQ